MRNASTVNSFKTLLNGNRQIPPKYLKVGTRIDQILQARLRMECSSLNAHLYSKNIVPTPSCGCGAFESPYHYLLHCPRYNAIRERYLHSYMIYYTAKSLQQIPRMRFYFRMSKNLSLSLIASLDSLEFYKCKRFIIV